jgi:hypothetical protein
MSPTRNTSAQTLRQSDVVSCPSTGVRRGFYTLGILEELEALLGGLQDKFDNVDEIRIALSTLSSK